MYGYQWVNWEKFSKDPEKNEYNEIKWNNIKNLSPGLYYAEVAFNKRESELIKLAIIQLSFILKSKEKG